MKLSELVALGDGCPQDVYGVVVDEPSFSPPAGLKRVGILWPMDGDAIDEIDVVISYGMAGVDVLMEIPGDREDVDVAMLVSTAANIGASLSILPPSNLTPESLAGWIERVCLFAKDYLKTSIFSKDMLPVTSYLEYMFRQSYGDNLEGFAPTDPYIIERFVSGVSVDQSDAMKAALRAEVLAAFGGQEQFDTFAIALAQRVYSSVDGNYRQSVAAANLNAADSGEASAV